MELTLKRHSQYRALRATLPLVLLIFIAVVIIFGDFVINIDIGVKHLEPSVSQTDVASSA